MAKPVIKEAARDSSLVEILQEFAARVGTEDGWKKVDVEMYQCLALIAIWQELERIREKLK